MDRFALRAANMLVGNDEGAAVLEAVFMGPELDFTRGRDRRRHRRRDAGPRSTARSSAAWTSFAVKKGQTLSFGYPEVGRARLYRRRGRHRRAGGARVSRSTYTIGALGGFKGRAIAGRRRAAGRRRPRRGGRPHRAPKRCGASPASRPSCASLPGLYWHRITPKSGRRFFADTWKVAPEADRIGYRFRGGKPLDFVPREQPFGAGSDPSNIVDACYPYGSIQVPGGTEPIVLHRDAVSGGGYFMLGTVISADMDLIGQLQPHTPTRFVEVTMDEALAARRDRKALLAKVREALG